MVADYDQYLLYIKADKEANYPVFQGDALYTNITFHMQPFQQVSNETAKEGMHPEMRIR